MLKQEHRMPLKAFCVGAYHASCTTRGWLVADVAFSVSQPKWQWKKEATGPIEHQQWEALSPNVSKYCNALFTSASITMKLLVNRSCCWTTGSARYAHPSPQGAVGGNETANGDCLLQCRIAVTLPFARNTLALHGRSGLCQESNGLIHHATLSGIAAFRLLRVSAAGHSSPQRHNLSQ